MPRRAGARIAIVAAVVSGVVVLGGIGVMYALVVDETRFARPDPAFDELATRVASVAGVSDVQKERWVEAPLFTQPHAWMSVAVTENDLAEVWSIACSSEYRDTVSWAFEVTAVADTRISLFSEAVEGCPQVGFEPAPVVTEIARLVPGEVVQAAIWDDRFALASIDNSDDPGALLPLVGAADGLRDAAGLEAGTTVEVSGPLLGVVIGPGEASRYHDLISRLIDTYGATGIFLGGGGTPIDGVEKVQLSAPAESHAAIERELADSALPIADLPVRFLP